MRIIIETDEGEKPSMQQERAAEAEAEGAAAPPEELAARAAAQEASSAGPAPAEMGAEGSAPFVEAPGTPATALEGAHAPEGAMAAGGAPGFATGTTDVDEVEAGEEADADDDAGS